MTTNQENVVHPDIEWCKQVLRQAKGDRITEEELDTVRWWGDYYGCNWRGMFLGIEKDGHIHS